MSEIEKRFLTWEEFGTLSRKLAERLEVTNRAFDQIIALSRGGLPLGVAMSHRFSAPLKVVSIKSYNDKTHKQGRFVCDLSSADIQQWKGNVLICDDIADTGKTMNYLMSVIEGAESDLTFCTVATLFYKEKSLVTPDCYAECVGDEWIVFPWEY